VIAALIAIGCLVAAPSTPAAASPGRTGEPAVPARAAIVVDAGTGAVIAGDRVGERLPIASATKLMTALLTLERADLGDVYPASGYEPAPVESQIRLEPGERLAVRDLLVALLLESANDAAVTLAEGVAGSTESFVAAMNERADELGLDDTSFANPIGFDHPDNYSTASDLARLASRLMRDARFRDIVEESSLRLDTGDRPRVVENRNELVGEASLVDGIKTGHTLAGGHVLVGSAARGRNRVISVVLGASGEEARDAATLELLRYGLDQFARRRVVRPGETLARAAIADREGDRVALAAAEGVTLTLLRGERVRTRIDAPSELEGPLAAGDEVGSATILRGGRVAGRVPLLTAAEVPGPGILTRVATSLGDHLTATVAAAAVLAGAAMLLLAHRRRRRARADANRAR
jgi:serine-type D-Ala-D-Ala carboxypeptidase (penicillin-binding protein 5/6)